MQQRGWSPSYQTHTPERDPSNFHVPVFYQPQMTSASISAPDSATGENYVILGIAQCYVKQEGEITPVKILEPVPSAYFAALMKGVPTSYEKLYGVSLSEGIENTGSLQQGQDSNVQLCQNFSERAQAAARTYQSAAAEQPIPIGQTLSELNFSTERKRILNASHVVNTQDNVKQHKYTHMTL